MNSHRYKYICHPIHMFLSQLSHSRQVLLTIAKVLMVLVLVGFQYISVNGVL
jgi:hypothetical protein